MKPLCLDCKKRPVEKIGDICDRCMEYRIDEEACRFRDD